MSLRHFRRRSCAVVMALAAGEEILLPFHCSYGVLVASSQAATRPDLLFHSVAGDQLTIFPTRYGGIRGHFNKILAFSGVPPSRRCRRPGIRRPSHNQGPMMLTGTGTVRDGVLLGGTRSPRLSKEKVGRPRLYQRLCKRTEAEALTPTEGLFLPASYLEGAHRRRGPHGNAPSWQ